MYPINPDWLLCTSIVALLVSEVMFVFLGGGAPGKLTSMWKKKTPNTIFLGKLWVFHMFFRMFTLADWGDWRFKCPKSTRFFRSFARPPGTGAAVVPMPPGWKGSQPMVGDNSTEERLRYSPWQPSQAIFRFDTHAFMMV